MFLKRRGKSKRRRVRNFRDPQNLQMLPSSLLPSCIISLTFILVFLDSDLCAVWHLLTHLKAGGNGMFVFSSWEEAEGATSRYGCSTYGRSLSTTIWCTSSCEYYSLVPLGWMFSLCFVLATLHPTGCSVSSEWQSALGPPTIILSCSHWYWYHLIDPNI